MAVFEGPAGLETTGAGAPVGGATHFVQIVEANVFVMVDTEFVT